MQVEIVSCVKIRRFSFKILYLDILYIPPHYFNVKVAIVAAIHNSICMNENENVLPGSRQISNADQTSEHCILWNCLLQWGEVNDSPVMPVSWEISFCLNNNTTSINASSHQGSQPRCVDALTLPYACSQKCIIHYKLYFAFLVICIIYVSSIFFLMFIYLKMIIAHYEDPLSTDEVIDKIRSPEFMLRVSFCRNIAQCVESDPKL